MEKTFLTRTTEPRRASPFSRWNLEMDHHIWIYQPTTKTNIYIYIYVYVYKYRERGERKNVIHRPINCSYELLYAKYTFDLTQPGVIRQDAILQDGLCLIRAFVCRIHKISNGMCDLGSITYMYIYIRICIYIYIGFCRICMVRAGLEQKINILVQKCKL